MARLLVVPHSPTLATRRLTEQVVAGAHDDAITGVQVEVVAALEADLAAAEAADGSGAPTAAGRRPNDLWVHGRHDTTGAVRSVQAIAGALPWRQASEVLEVLGDVGGEDLAAAYELGGTIAALLAD